MKSLIVYYSYGGNTRNTAQKIQEQLGGDILEIEPVVPYTTDYQQLVDDEEAKMDDAGIVEIKEIIVDFKEYNRIVIGTPVWWYQITPPLRGFLSSYKAQLSDKKIDAFITNGGWLGHSVSDIEEYVSLNSYVNLEFDKHIIRESSKQNLKKWLSSLKGE